MLTSKEHGDIAHDVLTENDFELVLLISIDAEGNFQICTATETPKREGYAIALLRRITQALFPHHQKQPDRSKMH